MTIHVFKTNMSKRLMKRADLVFKEQKEVMRWSVDLDDKDRVLRFESASENPILVINNLRNIGIYCEELQ